MNIISTVFGIHYKNSDIGMKHWLKHLLQAIFLFIFILLLSLFGLITTETGLHLLIHQLQQWSPGQLQIGNVSGRLSTGFRFTDISYQQQETQVQLQELIFTWQWRDLLKQQYHINTFHINGLNVKIPQSAPTHQQPTTAINLPNIQLPIKVVIDDLQINHTQFSQITLDKQATTPIILNHLQLQTQVQNNIVIEKLSVDLPQLQANVNGKIALQQPYSTDFKVNWTGNLPQLGDSSGYGKITGNIQELQFTHNLLKPFSIDLQTTVYNLITALHWQTQLQWKQISFPIDDKQKITSQQGELNASGNLQQAKIEYADLQILNGQVAITGDVTWQPNLNGHIQLQTEKIDLRPLVKQLQDKVTLNSELEIELIDNKVEIKQANFKFPETATQLTIVGQADIKQPHIQAQIDWKNVQFPLVTKQPIVNTKQGSLKVTGNPDDYIVEFIAEVAGQDIPKGKWQIVGQGNTKQFQFKELQGDILKGKIGLIGQLTWQPKISWQLALTGDKINPGVQWSDIPGQLAIDVTTEGERSQNGQIIAEVNIKQIVGKLRQYPLSINGIANVKGDKYQLKQFLLLSGKNRLQATGHMDKQIAVDWQIDAPQLTSLLPDLSGSLSSKGSVKGALTTPRIMAHVNGNKLHFQDSYLDDLTADINANLQNLKELAINIVATDFKQGNTQVEQVTVKTQGTLHTLTAILPKNKLLLQLRGEIDLKKQKWQGLLQQLAIESKQYGEWQLQNPSTLSLTSNHVQLAKSCLQGPSNMAVCTALDWQAQGNTVVHANLQAIPLELANQFLSPQLAVTGELTGNISANLAKQGQLTTHVNMDVTPGTITTNISEEVHQHQGGQLRVDVTESGLVADLRLSALQNSGLTGHVVMPQFTKIPMTGNQPIRGEISLHFNDLDILPTIVPQAENTQGAVSLVAQMNGDLQQPNLQGKLNVKELSAYLPDLGMEIKNFNLALENAGEDSVLLQASGLLGEGQLQIQGKANGLTTQHWNAAISIKGDKLTVVDMPTVWASASPDLQIHILPNAIDVKGDLLIPEANITPPDISNTVTESKDVVIINSQKPVTQSTSSWKISSAVHVVLGDKIYLEVADFKSRLAGDLSVSNQPNKPTVANGELLIVDGTYKAYGQDLKIEKGRVIFAGGPVENPALDIKATRKINDVTAGVHIQGTATAPELSLFSQPTLDQTNILSYIVLGRPASQATQGDGNALAAAAAALPLKEGDKIAKQLGDDFNLDEVSLGSEGNVEETALTVGKYLSPKLYISYGIGLFDASNILKMRYQLSKSWFLETETGKQSGVDLRYILER